MSKLRDIIKEVLLEKKKADQEAAKKQAEEEALAHFKGEKRMDVDELAQEIAIGR